MNDSALTARRPAMPDLYDAMLLAKTEWAVKNDCNGVFETRPRRAEAKKLLETQYAGIGAYVVPVKIIEITDDFEIFHANAQEDEVERYA